MLWKDFVCTLLAEDLKSGFLAYNGQVVELAITVSPKGTDDPLGAHLYVRREKLKLLILDIKQASSRQITILCAPVETLPAGFKYGSYTLRFTITDDKYVCGDYREDIEQMLLDEEIPTDVWEALQPEASTQG